MQLYNKKILIVILIVFILIIFIIIKRDEDIVIDKKGNQIYVKALNEQREICRVPALKINILEHMKDGMDNPILSEYYQEDIQAVYDITISKHIAIRYYDVDLNDDGQNEFIVIIQSSLHSGILGDSFDILLNEEGSYAASTDKLYTFPLLGHNCEPIGELFVLNSNTNGYRDLEVICEDEIHFYLVYDGESYVYVTEEKWAQKTGK